MTVIDSPPWQALQRHADVLRGTHLRDLFATDRDRFDRLSLRSGGLLLDYSKQRVTPETMALLRQLAEAADLRGWMDRMLAGDPINHTEHRAVLHVALRRRRDEALRVGGHDVMPEIHAVLDRMQDFCQRVQRGRWRGYSGEPISDIVNIGIGGSDLGPKMAADALSAYQQPNLRVHFVSNLDGAHLARTLAGLNPRTTLFVVVSKTFTTAETLTNARTARRWLLATAGDERAVAKHFVAASTNLDETTRFGIAPENVFAFWDWVGGRFSLWSAVGLSLALAIGFSHFEQLLDGARAMDEHFFTAPAATNLPLTLALLDIWNTDFLGAATHAVLPYSQSLALFPHHLQQLEMESNGKRVGRDGETVACETAPVLWGEAGTGGQHAFYQLLHQGGRIVPCDFIALGAADYPLAGHHEALLANCLAQSAALAFGKSEDEVRRELATERLAGAEMDLLVPYKVFPGNQPSTTLVLPRLSPFTLGQLIALYEHKVFALGVIWNLNAYDQWGVELGKRLASRLLPVIAGEAAEAGLDASTCGILEHLLILRGERD